MRRSGRLWQETWKEMARLGIRSWRRGLACFTHGMSDLAGLFISHEQDVKSRCLIASGLTRMDVPDPRFHRQRRSRGKNQAWDRLALRKLGTALGHGRFARHNSVPFADRDSDGQSTFRSTTDCRDRLFCECGTAPGWLRWDYRRFRLQPRYPDTYRGFIPAVQFFQVL